jgi:hypothetical protein
LEHTLCDNGDEFIDNIEEQSNDKLVRNREEAEKYVQAFFNSQLTNREGLLLKENKALRNMLISELKRCSSLSVRDLSDITGIGRNVIQRIK